MKIDILKEPPTLTEIDVQRHAAEKSIRRYEYALYVSFGFLVVGFGMLFLSLAVDGFSFEINPYHLVIIFVFMMLGGGFAVNLEVIIEDKKIRFLDVYSEATPESCIQIKKWMVVPEIKAYRDKIVDQSRKFIQAEVVSMYRFYENHQQYLKGEESRQACREVYGVTEGGA